MDPIGIWTEGWGHAMRAPDTGKFLKGAENKAKANKLHSINDETQANAVLTEDLAEFSGHVAALIKVDVSDDQFGALVSFAYNVGYGSDGLGGSTLLKLLNAGNYIGAADQFPRWNKSGGKVLKGLVKRRQDERNLFLAGTSA
ncbi:lysozyme [Candidatus Methylospira mobilis]|uniref:Lysozyme n=2 Tax=Candidatus Methylospira mobilis TaxID=1808979 RepID=A0A5Q0BKX1_9GAMM|nr:lysozyme [Candidatus Methylospira mobilis]